MKRKFNFIFICLYQIFQFNYFVNLINVNYNYTFQKWSIKFYYYTINPLLQYSVWIKYKFCYVQGTYAYFLARSHTDLSLSYRWQLNKAMFLNSKFNLTYAPVLISDYYYTSS